MSPLPLASTAEQVAGIERTCCEELKKQCDAIVKTNPFHTLRSKYDTIEKIICLSNARDMTLVSPNEVSIATKINPSAHKQRDYEHFLYDALLGALVLYTERMQKVRQMHVENCNMANSVRAKLHPGASVRDSPAKVMVDFFQCHMSTIRRNRLNHMNSKVNIDMQAKMAKEVEDIDHMKVQRTALQAELDSD